MANTEVPDLARYDRAVLQWQGDIDVALHAFEAWCAFWWSGPCLDECRRIDGRCRAVERAGTSCVLALKTQRTLSWPRFILFRLRPFQTKVQSN